MVHYRPEYPDGADYNTNAKSYYDDLARKEKLIKVLALKVGEYDKELAKRFEEWDKLIDDFPDDVKALLEKWLADGTLKDIINEEIFNSKADREDLIALEETLTLQMEQILVDIDEKFLLLTNQLTKKIDDSLSNVVPFAKYKPDPTGIKDSLPMFNQALNELKDNETLLLEPKALYYVSEQIKKHKKGTISIDGNGSSIKTDTEFSTDGTGCGFNFEGIFKNEKTIATPIIKGKNIITLNNVTDLKIGDLLYFHSNEQFNSNRDYYKKGGVFTIGFIKGKDVYINGHFPYNMDNCSISVYNPLTVKIKNLDLTANKVLPKARFGIHIAFATDSSLENIFSDNFNHCFHLSHHFNTTVEKVKSGRSYFSGSGESYGFSNYMGSLLKINNSTFLSGRHGLDLSGFENSFNITLMNVTASSEMGHIGFNMHESTYNVVAINCLFDRVGLSNHATLMNCTIGSSNGDPSNIKTGNQYDDTFYVFKDCLFSNNHKIISSRFKQTTSDDGKYIGSLVIENCSTDGFLMLDFTAGEVRYRNLIVKNTRNVGINNIQYNCVIKSLVFEDVVWDINTNWITQGADKSSLLQNIYLTRCRFINKYNVLRITRFEKMVIDNCSTINLNDGNPSLEIESREPSGTIIGILKIVNSELTRITLNSNGLKYMSLVNSTLTRGGNTHSNILTKKTTSLVDL